MTIQKLSALETLKNLGAKKPAPGSTVSAVSLNDPAIAGAKRVAKSSVVTLGFDPGIAETAARTAALKTALDAAQAEFAVVQGEMRDYGKAKRSLFNDTYKTDVTTVAVPYNVETPTGPESQVVQIICSNKYSVNNEVVLNNRETLGAYFPELFETEVTKSLRPNAEDLIRATFTEMGLEGESLENAMESLFETKTKVSTKKDYEDKVKKVPEPLKAILDVSVTRASPGLKFG